MKKLLPLLILLTSLHLTALGQHTFGLKISGGVSYISNSLGPKGTEWKVSTLPPAQAGAFYILDIKDKHIFGAELLFIKIKGKEKWYAGSIDGNGYDFNSSIHIYNNLSYIGLPIYYGIKFNKLTLNAGMQISYPLSGKRKEEIIYYKETDGPNRSTENQLNLDRWDYGPRAGVIFNLNKNISFEGMYYYGLNSIDPKNSLDIERKIQQATIGIRYTLTKKTEKDSDVKNKQE